MSKKLLFFIAEDWYFCSHRLPIALNAISQGYDVYLITRISDRAGFIENQGIKLIPFQMSRRSVNPFTELLNLWRLRQFYKRIKPDVVHHVAIKPVLYGTLISRICGVKGVVNSFAGMGILFSSQFILAKFFKRLFILMFKLVLNGCGKLVLQNPDDAEIILKYGIVQKNQIELIRGSGVDLSEFRPVNPSERLNCERPVIIMVARMLWAKGADLLVKAARNINNDHHVADFLIVGFTDNENPTSIDSSILEKWNSETGVSFLGRRNDIPELLKQSDIACLPSSYGEGVPKSLIESAAAGLPIVTTDIPGCREVVQNNVNGILVPAGSVKALTAALLDLINHPEKRRKMGNAGRQKAIQEFSQEMVCKKMLSIYEKLHSP